MTTQTTAPSPTWVRIRDIARNATQVLPGEREMLRVPYDLLRPTGAVEVHGDLARYRHGDEVTEGRVRRGTLAEAAPGETVLVRLGGSSDEPEWWVCDVVEVNGDSSS